MKLTSAFTDTGYPDAARAYAHGEMGQKAWENLAKRPLFQLWLRSVLRHHFEGALGPCPLLDKNKS